MKRCGALLMALVVGCMMPVTGALAAASEESSLEGTITISGAWALYPIAVVWADEFRKLHPQVTIDVSAGGAGKGMVDCLNGSVDLGMLSREMRSEEKEKGAWALAVTKDAVVATMNMANPAVAYLAEHGMTKQQFHDIWIAGTIKEWTTFGGTSTHPLAVYTRSDACGAAETWAAYLGARQENLLGVGVYGDPGLAEAVKKDVDGVGFNNINFVYDQATKRPVEGVTIIPVDVNENGTLDANERVYETREAITTAIADGVYPSPPARALYFVSKGKPARPVVQAFLKWILNEGQAFIPQAGYIALNSTQIAEERAKLES